MIFGFDKFDWKKSEAHLLLLSKFIKPNSPSAYENPGLWEAVLREEPVKSINRLIKEGYLIEADISGHLDYYLGLSNLKFILKERNLKVSGNKPELIQRLITSDPEFAKKLASKAKVYICSEIALPLANEYLQRIESERAEVEEKVLNYLNQKQFEQASKVVASFEAKQVFQRGMNIDWQNHKPHRDVEILTYIFSSQPKILKQLTPTEIDSLRIASGLMFLWGKNSGKKWMPENSKLSNNLDIDVAIRMLSFYANNKFGLANYLANKDVIIGVKILSVEDSCNECKTISGKFYKLNEAIEIPYEHCTHKMGCRCCYLPQTKSMMGESY